MNVKREIGRVSSVYDSKKEVIVKRRIENGRTVRVLVKKDVKGKEKHQES